MERVGGEFGWMYCEKSLYSGKMFCRGNFRGFLFFCDLFFLERNKGVKCLVRVVMNRVWVNWNLEEYK